MTQHADVKPDVIPPPPLWRNRAFNLLWGSQALSELGANISALAMPLLVLAVTGSPVQAGVIGSLTSLVRILTQLPAGVLADRVNRRRTLIAADAVRLIAFALLGLAIANGRATITMIIVVALINACGSVLFDTVERSALRTLVPAIQLPAAVARNEARSYATSLGGPPLGGLLFGIGRALPFVADAITYVVSMIAILFIRQPMQQRREAASATRTEAAVGVAEGIRFVFGDPFLRAVILIAAPLNLAVNGAIFSLIVVWQRAGMPPALIGTAATIVGLGGLLGALAAPFVQRRLSLPVVVRAVCWGMALLVATSALLTSSIAAAIPIALGIFLGPACNAALFGYQAAITPDRLQGRVVSVILAAAMSMSVLAPIMAGVIIANVGGPAAMLTFALVVAGSALAATWSQGIRSMRPLADVAAA